MSAHVHPYDNRKSNPFLHQLLYYIQYFYDLLKDCKANTNSCSLDFKTEYRIHGFPISAVILIIIISVKYE